MRKLVTLVSLAPLMACSTVPSGPSALVLPGDQKNPAQFKADDAACRKAAHAELISDPHQPQSLSEGQLHFDIHYLQCMYTKGHLIPLPGEVISETGVEPSGESPAIRSPAASKP